LFEGGADVATQTAMKRIPWATYKIDVAKDKVAVFVSLVSTKIPFKGTGKEYIGDDVVEIRNAVRGVIKACCLQLRAKLVRASLLRARATRKKNLSKYIPDVTRALLAGLQAMEARHAVGGAAPADAGSAPTLPAVGTKRRRDAAPVSTAGAHAEVWAVPRPPASVSEMLRQFGAGALTEEVLKQQLSVAISAADPDASLDVASAAPSALATGMSVALAASGAWHMPSGQVNAFIGSTPALRVGGAHTLPILWCDTAAIQFLPALRIPVVTPHRLGSPPRVLDPPVQSAATPAAVSPPDAETWMPAARAPGLDAAPVTEAVEAARTTAVSAAAAGVAASPAAIDAPRTRSWTPAATSAVSASGATPSHTSSKRGAGVDPGNGVLRLANRRAALFVVDMTQGGGEASSYDSAALPASTSSEAGVSTAVTTCTAANSGDDGSAACVPMEAQRAPAQDGSASCMLPRRPLLSDSEE
ncbi:hypothetical protein EON68_02605, partial [archaeon]